MDLYRQISGCAVKRSLIRNVQFDPPNVRTKLKKKSGIFYAEKQVFLIMLKQNKFRLISSIINFWIQYL